MAKPRFIEPFQIVRARKMRRERMWRLGLGLALSAAVFLGIGGIGGCAAPAAARGAGPAFGAPVLAPMGAFDFCTRHPEECEPAPPATVALDAEVFALLAAVNAAVNGLPQFPDEATGFANRWQLAGEAGGDCENLALEKRRRLREAGLPAAALLIATAEQWNGDHHALLLVLTDRGALALDNLDPQIRPAGDTGYLFRAVMSPENPRRWLDAGAAKPAHLLSASTGTQAKDPLP